MKVRVEFTIEPFVDGEPGPHVHAALSSLQEAGVEAEFGPFGTAFVVDSDGLAVLSDAVAAALGEGATRVSTQIEKT